MRKSLALFVTMAILGVFSFGVRRVFHASGMADVVVDAGGTIAWSGCLTSILAALFLFIVKNEDKTKNPVLSLSLAISLGVEFLQATSLLKAYENNLLMHLIFGSQFSWFDIPFYIVGVFIAWGYIFKDQILINKNLSAY